MRFATIIAGLFLCYYCYCCCVEGVAVTLPTSKHGVETFGNVTGACVKHLSAADRTRWTMSVGYANRMYMGPGLKALAQMFVNDPRYCNYTVFIKGIGVLDPYAMYEWDDSEVPQVFQTYSTMVGWLWYTEQISSLNEFMVNWADAHDQALFEDFPRQASMEAQKDGNWLGIPWLLSSRSSVHNMTEFVQCGIPQPPPWNDTRYPGPPYKTYTWDELTSDMLKLAACGVKKPMILEECMSTPFVISAFHDSNIYVYGPDQKTCMWRSEDAVEAFYRKLWPILKAGNISDPNEASMVKQWINFYSPIMLEYHQTPQSQWPSTRPAPLPRSDCNLATHVEGESSHYAGPAPEIRLVDSPGKVNSFQSWYYSNSSRIRTPEGVKFSWDFLSFITDNTNPVIFNFNLATKQIPPLESVRATPEFQQLILGTAPWMNLVQSKKAQITERLNKKGRVLSFPHGPLPALHSFEQSGVVSRLVADIVFKEGLSADNWDDPVTVKAAIRHALGRAADLWEFIALPPCTARDNALFAPRNNTPDLYAAFDPAQANVSCMADSYAQFQLARSPDSVRIVPCKYPDDTIWVLDSCDASGSTVARTTWNPNHLNVSCRIAPPFSVDGQSARLGCPMIASWSLAGILVLAVSAVCLGLMVTAGVFVVLRRRAPAIAAGSWVWSLVLLGGCMLLTASALTLVNERTSARCTSFVSLLTFGLTGVLASLYVKLDRVRKIFKSQQLQVQRRTDATLVPPFLGIVGVQTAIWGAWLSQVGSASTSVLLIDDVVRGVYVGACEYGSPAVIGVWVVFFFGLLILNIYLAYKLYRVPDQFAEPQFVAAITVGLTFILVLSFGLYFALTTVYQQSSFFATIVLSLGVLICGTYFGPKIWRARGVHKAPQIHTFIPSGGETAVATKPQSQPQSHNNNNNNGSQPETRYGNYQIRVAGAASGLVSQPPPQSAGSPTPQDRVSRNIYVRQDDRRQRMPGEV